MDRLQQIGSKYILYFLIALTSMAVYWNTLGHDFTWDDQLVISQNKVTQQGFKGLTTIWTSPSYIQQRPIYRPVSQSVQAIVWGISPNNPSLHHYVNVAFYTLCCLVFFYFLTVYFSHFNKWTLFIITLIFTILPVHSEVVANSKSLDEILSLLFVLLALIALKKYSLKNILLGGLMFALAVLSKISAIVVFPIFFFPLIKQNLYKLDQVSKIVKPFFNPAILSATTLLAVYAYLKYYALLNPYSIYFLFLVAPCILFIKPRYLKLVGLLLLSFLLTIEGIWELAIVLYFLHLINEDLDNKKARILLLIEGAIILIFTFGLGQNYIFNLPFLAAGLGIFYGNKNYSDKRRKNIAAVLVVVALITILVSYSETGLSTSMVFTCCTLAILLYFKHKNILRSIVILVLYIPVVFYSKSEILLLQSEESVVQLEDDQDQFDHQDAILPYHNILITSNSKEEKAATICRIQLVYLQKLFFPTALVHQHGTWQVQFASWKDWDVYLSIVIHLLLILLAFYYYKKQYYIAMWGILWYFITMSIYTNIVRLMPDTLAERFLFLPSIGFSIAFVSGLYFFIKKYLKDEKKSLITLAIILLPLMSYYAYKTIDRNQDWENNYTLASNTLPYAKNNAAINAQYALELNNLIKNGQTNNVDSAKALVVKHYEKAIEIFPNFYGPNADLASYYILEAQPDNAFPYLLESTRINPKEWIHHYYLGLIYYERNNYAEGINQFNFLIENETLQSRALEFPELLEAYEFSARCLHNTGKDNEAYAILDEAIAIFNQKSTYVLLANLYRVTGKQDLAIKTFNRLLVLTPNDQELINTIQLLEEGKIY